MGNNMGGANIKGGKSTKVMKTNGDLFKLKTPVKVFDVIKDYPDHVLLDSDDFLRFNLRSIPLEPEYELRPKKIYLLVELPKFPSPLRRVRSGVRQSRRDNLVKITRRSVSVLSITTKSTAARSTVGPTQVKMRLPKAVVERIVAESRDEVEVAQRILRLYLEDVGGDVAAPVVEDGGGRGEER